MKWYTYAQRDGLEKQTVAELGEVEAENFEKALELAKHLAKGRDIPGIAGIAYVVRSTPLEPYEYSKRHEALQSHLKIAHRHKKQRKVKDVYIPERDGIWAEGLKGVK
jgi:hypothetical protein